MDCHGTSLTNWRHDSASLNVRLVRCGFPNYALAEAICYDLYHLDWATFLLAHTIGAVPYHLPFALVFVDVGQPLVSRGRSPGVAEGARR